jgi:leucyl-tRNA---protein transferase
MNPAQSVFDPYIAWRFTAPAAKCSYLAEETASLDYRVSRGMPAAALGELLRRGWRRHGAYLFRPACPVCVKCRSVRVDVNAFEPSKSQRRCRQRNSAINVVMQRPTVTPAHIALYNKWHDDRTEQRQWRRDHTTREQYAESFLSGRFESAYEMLYYEGSQLVGVGLVDVVPDAVSSAYFFYDPAWLPAGPGTYSVLREIEFCQQTGRPWCYLGYWIAECPSMAYKNRFRPYEVLAAYGPDETEPEWRLAAEPSGS